MSMHRAVHDHCAVNNHGAGGRPRRPLRAQALSCLVAIVGACAGGTPKQEAAKAVRLADPAALARTWLRTDCYVGDEFLQMEQALQAQAAALAPLLEDALRNGPPADYRREVADGRRQFEAVVASQLDSAETAGLAERLGVAPQQLRNLLATHVDAGANGASDAYRDRAALGMVLIRLDSARDRLREIANDANSPLCVFAQRALSHEGR